MSNYIQRFFNEEELKNMINDYNDGVCLKDIGLKYDRDPATIIGKLKSLGIFIPKNVRWTQEEIDFLTRNYSNTNWDVLLSNLSRHPKEDIIRKAYKLKIKKENYFWNENDVKILKDNYNSETSVNEIKSLLGNKFTYEAISTKANKLGLQKVFPWTDKEIDILKSNYENISLEELCILLPKRKSVNIIRYANKKLGLTRTNFWKNEDINFIKNNWEKISDKELAETVKHPLRSTKAKRCELGLYRFHEKGTYDNLSEYVRKKNKKWKYDSARNCGFKCYFTGERFQDIHHIYGMNMILNEVLETLEIDIKDDFNDYSEEELASIVELFIEIQNKYPLGICLRNDIHKLFHNIYGYGYNTQDQWNEFVETYNCSLAQKAI